MTTTATKRMRFAALGLATALSIGGLAPFIGTGEASAATSCTVASAHTSAANAHLAVDQAKKNKAKKKVKKLQKHHASKKKIKKAKKKFRNLKKKVRADKAARQYYVSQQKNCTTSTTKPGGSTTTSSNPLDALNGLLGLLSGSGLSPAALTDALNGLASQIAASGVPGADQLAGVIDELSSAIGSGAASLDPSQLQSILGSLPAGVDPAAFQSALTSALSQAQSEISAALADPTGLTASGLIDDIVNPLKTGLTKAGVPALPDVLTQVQGVLDQLLGGLGLGSLAGGTNPLSGLTGLLGGL